MIQHPLIRIEVEHMKQSMVHAFSEQLLNLDAAFKDAVDQACDPKQIQFILNDAADRYLKEALQEEVRNFFLNGEGRKAVKAAVQKRLSEDLGVF